MLLRCVGNARILRRDLVDKRVCGILQRVDAFSPVMESSIDPDASSTSTMSSGVVDVDAMFDVEESTESAVMKSESPLETVALMAPEMSISLVDTVLSVQIRPIFWVVFSTTPDQSPIVDASAIVSMFAAARIY